MQLDKLKADLFEIDTNMRAFLEHNRDYYELKLFKILMKGTTALAKMLFIGAVVVIVVLLISLTMAFGIGQILGSTFYGFLIVTVVFVFIGFVLYLLRNKLDKPILNKFSEYYFDEL